MNYMTQHREETINQLAQFFSALSDPSRLRILSVIMESELNVGDIAGQTGMSNSAVSHQLHGLRLMRIVRARREGRQVFYCLDDEHVENLLRQGLYHTEHR